MKKKKLCIYSLAMLLTTYQVSAGLSTTAFAAVSSPKDLIQDKSGGIYQADCQYNQWNKQHPDCIQGVTKWKKTDGKYQYPVTPYDKEWGNYMQNEEIYTACQIPQKILNQLSTEELLELVLDHPKLTSIYFYDSIEEGVKLLAERFNGLNALLTRKDCLSVVTQYYSEYKIPEKQQLDYDALLPGDNPDYYVIIDNEKLMRKADEDTKVMLTINLCEAIMEIASEENKMSTQEKQTVTKLIFQKTQEKAKSECVEGVSVEEEKEDSLLNECREIITGESKIIKTNTSTKGAGKDKSGSYKLADGGTVKYVIPANSKEVPKSTITSTLDDFKDYHLKNGDRAVTSAGEGGTTAYNCYNFAWLKKYDPANLWKKCTLNNDDAYRNYKYFSHANKPKSAGWVGSNGSHAVYVVDPEVTYVRPTGQVLNVPMVKSKWGPRGPLIKHPVTEGDYGMSPDELTYYC